MASAKQQLIEEIKDLESALKSEYTPANLKDDLRSEIAKSKKQLEELEEAEKKAQSKKPSTQKEGESQKKSALQKVKERLQKTKATKKKVEKKQVQAKKDEKPATKRTPVKKAAPKKAKRVSSGNQRDASRKALKPGWRKSKETGEWYYESRSNRSDSQRKSFPYLEDGGTTDFVNDGAGMFAKGGIFGSKKNLSRDRMFKSKEKWEQRYKRKTSPKNPRYKYEDGGEFTNEGAGMFESGGSTSSEKVYNVMYNVGKAKYLVNFHDGVKTHKDGSPFFAVDIFSNKVEFNKFINKLESEGYRKVYAEGGTTDFVNEGAGMFAKGGSTGEAHRTEYMYEFGGAIVDQSYGLLADPRFDVQSPIFAKGGKLSSKYNYLPKYKIATITTEDGSVIDGNDIIDGLYVKKKVKF